MCTRANGLEHYDACRCAGTGCGGHLVIRNVDISWASPGCAYLAAQHTYTPACAGFHAPGPCPPSQRPVWVQLGG